MLDNIQFSSVSEFFQMGKYTFHVWSVYGLFALFVFVNLFLPRVQRRQFIREQRQRALRDVQLAQNTAVNEERSRAQGEGE
ncbi:MAG: heme exporter protein CcmD [Gammaproteobacteria bacterium]